MKNVTEPTGVHLVGSLPLHDENEVFRMVSSTLGRHVRRIPDGETGNRQQWVQFQLGAISRMPEFDSVPNMDIDWGELPPTLKLKDGIAASDVEFGKPGYGEIAQRSFATFDRFQRDGVIPQGVRFQVSMPTPLANAVSAMQLDPQFPELYRRYRDAVMAEVAEIADAIPHDRLAIQWDVCFELLMIHGWMPTPPSIDKQTIAGEMIAISDPIPDNVELGYHFCFGDFGHRHLQEPDDTAGIVELAGSFLDRVNRPVSWLHVPVPIQHDDDAYFAALTGLPLPDEAELYLGLVHFRDGVAGAQRRIATAQRFVDAFGVSTECGMGRRPSDRGGADDTLPTLLAVHAEVASPVRA